MGTGRIVQYQGSLRERHGNMSNSSVPIKLEGEACEQVE